MVRIEQSSTPSAPKTGRPEYVEFERFFSMKRSLKALLAIAVSSAATIAPTSPSFAVAIGESDEATFTGVYSSIIEATRSCTISARGNSEGVSTVLEGGFSGPGTTIQLGRKAGSQNATGSVRVDFEAIGANAVYFEEDKFIVAAYDGDEFDQDQGSGSVSVKLASPQPFMSRSLSNDLVDAVEAEGESDLENPSRDGVTLAEISGSTGDVDEPTPGLILGGLVKGKGRSAKNARSLTELSQNYSRPQTRSAILRMQIDNVDKLGTSVIQARLVCAPIGLEDSGNGTIRPRLGGI